MQHCIRASLPYKNRTKLQKKHGKKTPKNNTDRNRRTTGMLTQFARTELLLGKEAMEKLKNSRVAVFGVGGVGGYVCEALVRSGVGAFDLIDDDKVCLTNLNRQIIATRKTVGKYKTEVMKERILEINPDADVRLHQCFFLPENSADFPFEEYDYVVDAVDTVTAKIVSKSHAKGIKKTRCEKIKGGLFRGTADKTDRRYGDQLQNELYLPTGSRA